MRDISSTVLPLCVSAATALMLRLLAVNTVARAIASSTSAGGCASRRSCEKVSSFSASTQTRAMAATVSTGYLPAAVSAESITASVPSSTALATSDTSARVGIGLLIIDSIICVAVMVMRFFSRAMRIMRFCSAGTTASPTSTARSPRATMMQSEASRMSSSAGYRLRALDLRHRQRPAARLVHEIARPAHVFARAGKRDAEEIRLELGGDPDVLLVLLGQRGRGQAAALAVDALVVGQRSALLHDASDARPPDRRHAQHDAPVVEQQRVARPHVVGQLLVVEPDRMLVAQRALGVEHELRARRERDLAVPEAADADLGALQVDQHADRAARLARERAHQLHAPACARRRCRGRSSCAPRRARPRSCVRASSDRSRRVRGWPRFWCGGACECRDRGIRIED